MGVNTTLGSEAATYEPGSAREGFPGPLRNLDLGRWMSEAREMARGTGERLATQVREHPIGSMVAAGAVGFVLASALRSRSVPGVIRAAVGIAAAALIREVIEYGMAELTADETAMIDTGLTPGQLAPD